MIHKQKSAERSITTDKDNKAYKDNYMDTCNIFENKL